MLGDMPCTSKVPHIDTTTEQLPLETLITRQAYVKAVVHHILHHAQGINSLSRQ